MGFNVLFLSNGEIMLLGGYDNKKIISQTEIYNPIKRIYYWGPKLDVDSPILKVEPAKQEFATSNFMFKYDEDKNEFKKNQRKSFSKYDTEISLNDKYSLLYKKCNDFMCSSKTKLYIKGRGKIFNGPYFMYNPSYNPGVIDLGEGRFLIYNNVNNNDLYAIKNTQILKINERKINKW